MGIIQTIGLPQQPPVAATQYGAGILTDPRMMPMVYGEEASYKTAHNTSTRVYLAVPSDFVSYNASGSTTRHTVLNVDGSGVLTHIIPSASNINSNNITIYLTVDKEQYTIAITASNKPFYYGVIIEAEANTDSGTATINQKLFGFGTFRDCGHLSKLNGYCKMASTSSCIYLPSVAQVIAWGLPRLRFESRLKIEMINSVAPNSANAADYEMVGYQLDTF